MNADERGAICFRATDALSGTIAKVLHASWAEMGKDHDL